jgi:acetyltransferase-like isoleucine patch superfamily enzyme
VNYPIYLRVLVKKLFALLPVNMKCKFEQIYSGGKLTLGTGSYVHNKVHILGLSNVKIGKNSCISEGCWLNVNHRETKEPAIIIGNNCFIGKNNFFSSGSVIFVGDYTLTTIDCKLIGSSHIISDPFIPYIVAGTTNESSIRIGVNCFLGASVMVIGDVRIGHGSIIGAGAQVISDIPSFSIVVGVPARVIKRFSFLRNDWVSVNEITEEDINAFPDEITYLSKIQENYQHINLPWIAAAADLGNV